MFTNTYYINKYKITFSFDNKDYIIILSIAFYNENKIKIVNLNRTETINDLGYTNYTFLDETLTLAPCIYKVTNIFKLYENIIDYEFLDTKYYSYIINYDNVSKFKDNMNSINVNSFYYFISNIIPNIEKYANCFNIIKRKVNNFINNIILLSQKFNSIKYNMFDTKSIMHMAITLDCKISKEYIDEYKHHNNNLNLKKFLPNGKYKIFKFHNYNPENEFLITNPINDIIVKNIDNINEYTKNNFCLLIKIAKDNNKPKNKTEIYLCSSYKSGNPYVTTIGNIYVLKLFDYKNYDYDIIINLITNKYVNFYQMNFIIEQYNYYNEFNTMVINFNDLFFKNHKCKNIKKIIENDYERFNICDENNKNNENNENNETIISDTNECERYEINLSLKNIIYLLNSYKNLYLTKKIIHYLNQLKFIKIYNIDNSNYQYYITIIIENAKQCLINILINYNLNITYGTTSSFVNDTYNKLKNLSVITTLNDINNLIINCKIICNYYKEKIQLVKTFVKNNENIIGKITYCYLIFDYLDVQIENIFNLESQIDLDQVQNINNFNLLQFTVLKNIIYVIKYNSLSLNEIMNKLILINEDKTLDGIFGILNIAKNKQVYNNNFNIQQFLIDLKVGAPPSEIIIIDNILTILNNHIKLFIAIYKFEYNIVGGVITPINPNTIDIDNVKTNLNNLLIEQQSLNNETINIIIPNFVASLFEYLLYLQYYKLVIENNNINNSDFVTQIYNYVILQKNILQYGTQNSLYNYYKNISNNEYSITNKKQFIQNVSSYSNDLAQFIANNLNWNLETIIKETENMFYIINTTNILTEQSVYNFNSELVEQINYKNTLSFCEKSIGYIDLQLLYLNIEKPI